MCDPRGRENSEAGDEISSGRRDGVEDVEGLANAGMLKGEQEHGQRSRGGQSAPLGSKGTSCDVAVVAW